MQQSGEGIYTGGSTPRANRHVRNMIIEAAWIAVRTDHVMQTIEAMLAKIAKLSSLKWVENYSLK